MSDTIMRLMPLQAKDYPCSQMMMILALEEQGRENPALVRAMAGLAKGVGNCAGSCGAMTGGACILALYAGKGGDDEQELEAFKPMRTQLNEWFAERTGEYGGSLCHQITENKAGSVEMAPRCGQLIADTYDKVMQLLVENEIDPGQARDDD
ncbi:MAG: C_GCAxxG_C_C family protein [Desulfobacteraceae bacterium]|nr:C_GCAxxG_C_C family protein [Desulfobacteraceae bacterium]